MSREPDSQQEAMLFSIEEKHNQSTLADYELDEMVLAAHAAGVSWERIAVRLGVTRQAAAEKYGAMERRRKSDVEINARKQHAADRRRKAQSGRD